MRCKNSKLCSKQSSPHASSAEAFKFLHAFINSSGIALSLNLEVRAVSRHSSAKQVRPKQGQWSRIASVLSQWTVCRDICFVCLKQKVQNEGGYFHLIYFHVQIRYVHNTKKLYLPSLLYTTFHSNF